MDYQPRQLEATIKKVLNNNKSILLLGPRQTGKTTLIQETVNPDRYYTFLNPELRIKLETSPILLQQEIMALHAEKNKLLKIVCDEIQKVPILMDVVQYLIDSKVAQFVLTGSSARKLKRQKDVNLLPGRVILLHLDALCLLEIPPQLQNLEHLLLYGSLPEIALTPSVEDREQLLQAYVKTYLEEEIRAEAIVRNIGAFARFLEYASLDLGQPINHSKLSQEIGITRNTVMEYYQILQDYLIADRIMPLSDASSRRRLTKSPKCLFFDLGVRRICTGEGTRISNRALGQLFEQFVGIEILRYIRLFVPKAKLLYWRDHAGPEVDYVISIHQKLIAIEVKWTTKPNQSDARHLKIFMENYKECYKAFIICQTSAKLSITENITALPWQELPLLIEEMQKIST